MSLERKGLITTIVFIIAICMAFNFDSLASQIIGWIGLVGSCAYSVKVGLEYERTDCSNSN